MGDKIYFINMIISIATEKNKKKKKQNLTCKPYQTLMIKKRRKTQPNRYWNRSQPIANAVAIAPQRPEKTNIFFDHFEL